MTLALLVSALWGLSAALVLTGRHLRNHENVPRRDELMEFLVDDIARRGGLVAAPPGASTWAR